MMKNALLLSFLMGMGGCVAIIDDSNLGVNGSGGPAAGSGGSGVIGSGGAPVIGTGGGFGSGGTSFGSGGTLGSGGAPGTGGSLGSGGASVADGGAGTGGRAVDGGVPDGGPAGTGGARVDAGTGTGGVMGTGGVTGTGGATVALVCTSKVTWGGGNGPDMRPGDTCNNCHSYSIIGTIYPTVREPNNCNGVSGSTGARVVITGANGTTLTLTPTAAGNFFSNSTVTKPYTARVTSGGATRAMVAAETSGNCNSCHTQNGANGAPGRIMIP